MRLLLLALALLAVPASAQDFLATSYDLLEGAEPSAPQMVTVTAREPVYTTVKVCHGTYCTFEKRLAGYRNVTRQVRLSPDDAANMRDVLEAQKDPKIRRRLQEDLEAERRVKPKAAPKPARAGRPCGCPADCDGFHCKSYPGTTCRRGDAAGCNCHGPKRR